MEEVNEFKKLENIFNCAKNSHAYLIETNDIEKCFLNLKNFIKKINCAREFKDKCGECSICNLIDQNSLPSLIIIEPDGINIRKEQVLELKRRFNTMPTFTANNIYIIKNAEKLNGSSANTMLKFIEEPTDNIIGFFITTNINNVIDTIRSRCEIIKIFFDENKNIIESQYFNVVKEYLYKLEVEKKDDIMYNRNVILNNYFEKEDVINIFKIMLEIYKHTLDGEYFPGNESFIFLNNISKEGLLRRVNLIVDLLNDINYNVNIELLLDKFVIELSD